jgi:hydrophobic/amphiphilic exporter-1 (mainly G- bacteria), HAE1 family
MSLAEFSTRRRVTIFMIMLTFVLFGLIALFDLKVNLLPDLSYPTLTVRTEYTGAAPSEIETLISEPIEEAVGVVKNLRKLKSISRTGQSDVVLEFAWGTNMDQASLEVRDKLEVLRLPLEAKAPVLLRFNPSTDPIMRIVMAAKTGANDNQQAELMRLRRFAEEELKKRLEPVDGVAAVKVGGGLEDEVQVQIDEQKLALLNLSPGQVVERLRQENVNISGGRVEEGSQRYLVRTVNQFTSIDQIGQMLISNVGGVPIRLSDVATVEQGFKEREAIIRYKGNESVELAIYKEGDANTVKTADAVKAKIEELKTSKALPADAELKIVEDQSKFINASLNEVFKEAFIGGALAILVIFIFLRDGWSTFVISLSLPVSIIATFFFMGQLGLSLNVMSLAGLALATGLVVDDSIVVLESIAKARERGLSVFDAAIAGTKEVTMAVVASTLTTVAVFFPLVFVQGIAGQLFKDQAITVSLALLISMFVSLTLIPMLSALKVKSAMDIPPDQEPEIDHANSGKMVKAGRAVSRVSGTGLSFIGVATRGVVWFFDVTIGRLMRAISRVAIKPYDIGAGFYRSILPKALDRPLPILLISTIAFAIALFFASRLGTDLIPQLAQDRFEMTAKLPPGTQLRDTDALVKAVQAAHGEDVGVEALFGVSGTGTRLDASPTESGENVAKLTVVLGDGYSAKSEQAQTEKMRKTMQRYPDVQVKFGRPQLLSFSTPLEIELRGQDLNSLEKAGKQLAQLLETSNHYADVKSTVEQGFPEVQIRFDQDRAAALGLTTRQIADQVVRQVRGEVATRYSFRDRKIDVLVRAREQDRSSVDDIRKILVNPLSQSPVSLSAVADVVETIGPSEIHRVDQVRVAIVSANLRDIDLGTAVKEVQAMVSEKPLGADIKMNIGGQGEELKSSLTSLFFAFGLAIFLVYLVMASQFESLLHPFVIMFSVPLAIVGAVMALVLSNSPVSVVVFIGLILLVGIVVKNAIVLIDKVNQLREEGVDKRNALIQAAESRLRPIIMTTITTLLGFAPLAFMGGEGAEIKSPMAITVIGGLTVSTVLTLIVIPVVYNLLDRKPDSVYRERGELVRKSLDPARHGDAA